MKPGFAPFTTVHEGPFFSVPRLHLIETSRAEDIQPLVVHGGQLNYNFVDLGSVLRFFVGHPLCEIEQRREAFVG